MVDQRRGAGSGLQGDEALHAPEGEEYGSVKGRTQREIIWRRFRRHRLALVGGAVLILLYIAAIVTPWIAPFGYAQIDFTALNQPPSLHHLMGTDRLGRDQLTRVMYGGRISLALGLAVGVFSTVIGATVGIISGHYGKSVDVATMGFVDFMLTLPFLPLLLVAGKIFQFTPITIIAALVLLLWPRMARLVVPSVLSSPGCEGGGIFSQNFIGPVPDHACVGGIDIFKPAILRGNRQALSHIVENLEGKISFSLQSLLSLLFLSHIIEHSQDTELTSEFDEFIIGKGVSGAGRYIIVLMFDSPDGPIFHQAFKQSHSLVLIVPKTDFDRLVFHQFVE